LILIVERAKSPFRCPPEECWYIVRSAPRAERKAAVELQQLGLRVFVPKRVFRPSTKRKTNPKPRRAPLFVGYILVKFPRRLIDAQRRPQFGIVASCRNISGPYVTYYDKRGDRIPMPLTDEDIGALIERRRQNEFNEVVLSQDQAARRVEDLRRTLKDGSPVLVVAGLYAGHVATVARVNDDASAEINIHLIGRDARMHVDDAASELEPLAKSRKAS
jgi:transcription antitermination factor NusG